MKYYTMKMTQTDYELVKYYSIRDKAESCNCMAYVTNTYIVVNIASVNYIATVASRLL